MTVNETPQDRVEAFTDEYEEWGQEFIATTGEYGTPIRYTLYTIDLRDVLNELQEHQKLLIQIDEILDDDGLWPREQLAKVRDIMGNNKTGRQV